MDLFFMFFCFFAHRVTSNSLIEETLIIWNDTTPIIFEELELTTQLAYNDSINSTNDTTEITIPEMEVSPRVKRILSELFRTFEPYCWRRSYGRGIGRSLHACPDHAPEQDGLLCYPLCEDGYNGVGPVCWEKCDNMTSLGFSCFDLRFSARSCPWYDKCGVFKRSCSSCPRNYTNFGCLCGRFHMRTSYGRGVGTPLVCSDSYEQDGALCYDKCNKKYNGVGPVCWQHCPASQPVPCMAGCSITQQDCQRAVIDMVQSAVGASLKVLHSVLGLPLVDLTALDLVASAAKGDWKSVAKDMSSLARVFAANLLPDMVKKFLNWSLGTVESATKNASLILTVAAFKDRKTLLPFLKFFRLDAINAAYNHGKCDLRDDFDDFLD